MKGTYVGKNNKKGYALAVTLVIMVALFILGIAVMAMSSTEAVHTALQYNNTQAYYSARSGIEVGLVKLQDSLEAGMFDTVDALYASVSAGGALTGALTAGRDTYTVQFLDGGLVNQDQMKIYSVGTQADMQATTALTLFFNSPNYMPLNWLNPGNIIKKGYWEMTTDALVVRTVKTTGHSVKKSTNVDTTWNARAIHFVDNDTATGFCLQVTAKAIEFQTNLLSFKYPVFYNKNLPIDTITFNPRKDKDTGIYEGFKNPDGTQPLLDATTPIPVGWSVLVTQAGYRLRQQYQYLCHETRYCQSGFRRVPLHVLCLCSRDTAVQRCALDKHGTNAPDHE